MNCIVNSISYSIILLRLYILPTTYVTYQGPPSERELEPLFPLMSGLAMYELILANRMTAGMTKHKPQMSMDAWLALIAVLHPL